VSNSASTQELQEPHHKYEEQIYALKIRNGEDDREKSR